MKNDGGIDLILTAAIVVGALILISAIGAIVVIRIRAANSKSKARPARLQSNRNQQLKLTMLQWFRNKGLD